MKIVIKSETVTTETRKGPNGEYNVHYQTALFHGAEETLKVRVPVESAARGYGAGEYMLASESFVRNKYESLELGRVKLEPLKSASFAADQARAAGK